MSTRLIPDGRYKIGNVRFSNQDADLLDGQPTAIIGGNGRNNNSQNMVWELKNVGNQGNQFTLKNVATSSNGALVSINQITDPLRGNPNYENIWTVVPALGPASSGRYWILAQSQLDRFVPTGLVWSLENGNNRTPVKLVPIVHSDEAQIWTFRPY